MVSGSPIAALATKTLVFGDEVIDTTSGPLPVTLTNSGTSALNIATITVGTNFEQTNNCGSSLASGADCVINVVLDPTVAGSLSGMVTITDNASDSPQIVSLTGTGTTVLGGSCSSKGQQCPPQFPPCCAGLVCTPASTRAFCE